MSFCTLKTSTWRKKMRPNPKAVDAALEVARRVGDRIIPGIGNVSMPRAGEGVPLLHAQGGAVDPAKAARRALMVASSLRRADGGETDAPSMAQQSSSRFRNLINNAAPRSSGPQYAGGAKPDYAGPTSIPQLRDAFSSAIAHHLSLSPEERQQNRRAADHALAPHIGWRKDGTLVPLLGKNAKMMKASEGYRGEEPVMIGNQGVETTGLALAPAYREGKFTTCPNSASCVDECLGKTSGNYFKVGGGKDLSAFKGPRLNSLKKTIAMMRQPEAFAVRLHDEIQAAKLQAKANGNHLGVRLNVLSDINPAVHKALMEAHPDVSFYDYTKNNTDPVAPNHHYTYSSTGVSQPTGINGLKEGVHNPHSNWKQMRRRLDSGSNVAMAFSHKELLPEEVYDHETKKTYKVVNGDVHDFRPLDIQPEGADGVIIGLKNKKVTSSNTNAAKGSNGFFVHYDPQLMRTEKGTILREEKYGLNPETGNPYRGLPIATNKRVEIAHQSPSPIVKTNDNAGDV